MANKTPIAWCDSTINWWMNCSKVSEECQHCYIERATPLRIRGLKLGGERVFVSGAIANARAMNRRPWVCEECQRACEDTLTHRGNGLQYCGVGLWHRRRIFTLSLGDLLDPDIPVPWLVGALETMFQCREVLWLICSKRWENWFMQMDRALKFCQQNKSGTTAFAIDSWLNGKEPDHFWLLCTTGNQRRYTERVASFLQVPARIHGLSIEPILGSIQLHQQDFEEPSPINWLIVGAESGEPRREARLEWFTDLEQQAVVLNVPLFVKQLGKTILTQEGTRLHFKARDGNDPAEWPPTLRRQEFPK